MTKEEPKDYVKAIIRKNGDVLVMELAEGDHRVRLAIPGYFRAELRAAWLNLRGAQPEGRRLHEAQMAAFRRALDGGCNEKDKAGADVAAAELAAWNDGVLA